MVGLGCPAGKEVVERPETVINYASKGEIRTETDPGNKDPVDEPLSSSSVPAGGGRTDGRPGEGEGGE